MKRVVITGLGAITPVGNDVATFWQNISAGVSGIGFITHFDTADYKVKIAAEVKDFDVTPYVDKMAAKRLGSSFLSTRLRRLSRRWTTAGLSATPSGSASISAPASAGSTRWCVSRSGF